MTFEEIEEFVLENKVRGWLLPEERRLLYELASKATPPFVELGSFCGLSTLYLAAALAGRDVEGEVWAVDNFEGQRGKHYQEKHWADSTKLRIKLRETIGAAGLSDYVRVVVADTIKASAYHGDEEVGLLFIDADHRLEGVRADYEVWYRRVALGGFIAMHNANGCGVKSRKIVHPGAMAIFSRAIMCGEVEDSLMIGTTGVGRKPQEPNTK